MTFIISWLRHKSLFLSICCLSSIAYAVVPVSAQDGVIRNTATVGGDNIRDQSGRNVINSNEVTLTAGQAALTLVKTADRAAVEPGETVVYRVAIRNAGRSVAASPTRITDRLPRGMRLIASSVRGTIGNSRVNVVVESGTNRTVTFRADQGLRPGETLTVLYAVEVTPEAQRGNGRNLAVAQAGNLRSNTASYQMRIRPGILSDCGTLIGRVFHDKNFDGEQQPNEPGIPNAVVYMDDGNRIVTDAKGMFSLPGVYAGYRSAVVDLSSIPGYGLAPNKYFIERNSQSRMVKVAPGSMVRVNFGVTPAFSEDKR